MADTGAPWNLPYPLATDLVRDGAQAIQDLAEATAAGLDAAGPDGFVFAGTRYYTSSGAFDKTDPFNDASVGTPKAIRVRAVGGGGSGGGASGTAQAAGGGAGGGYAERFVTDVAGLDSVVSVTVGAGGSAPAAGVNPGNAGGTSSFGTGGDPWLTEASGGGRGLSSTENNPTFPAGGGIAGDLLVTGTEGGSNTFTGSGAGGTGGASGKHYGGGGGGGGASRDRAGKPGGLYGGGGGGASSNGGAGAGGAGADGLVVIDIFV